jgi:hypothetical protein
MPQVHLGSHKVSLRQKACVGDSLTGLKPHDVQDIGGIEYLSDQPVHLLCVDEIARFL